MSIDEGRTDAWAEQLLQTPDEWAAVRDALTAEEPVDEVDDVDVEPAPVDAGDEWVGLRDALTSEFGLLSDPEGHDSAELDEPTEDLSEDDEGVWVDAPLPQVAQTVADLAAAFDALSERSDAAVAALQYEVAELGVSLAAAHRERGEMAARIASLAEQVAALAAGAQTGTPQRRSGVDRRQRVEESSGEDRRSGDDRRSAAERARGLAPRDGRRPRPLRARPQLVEAR